MKMNTKMKLSLTLIAFLVCLSPMTARADTINLGTLSYDTFIPGAPGSPGVDAFNISNLTGALNLPPDFPVLDDLTFQSATLTLSDGEQFDLGDIGPGFLLDGFGNPVIQVSDDLTFQTAEFKATLSETTFAITGGTFTADSDSIDIILLPSSGSNLTPDVDNTTITVSGQTTTAVPEPSTWVLILTSLPLLPWRAHRQLHRSGASRA